MWRKCAALLALMTLLAALAACGETDKNSEASGAASVTSAGAESSAASVTSVTMESSAASTASADAGQTLEDGSYTADFETDSNMFHLNETCDGKVTLTVKDGQMTAHVILASTGIVNLFLGTAEEAAADGASLIGYTEEEVTYDDGDTDTAYAFELPVPVIGEDFSVAILGTKGTWYDHTVCVENPVKN